MKHLKKQLVTILFFSFTFVSTYELHWQWNSISLTDISFPASFFWGIADSALQVEGSMSAHGPITEDSWLAFEKSHNIPVRVGDACERWTRYKEDIERAAQLGIRMYRFSICWSKIEPQEGIFDQAALDHYIDFVDCLLAHGITPMITLFHHSYPTWIDKKGGLEIFSNFYYFLRFSEHVFKQLHKKVPYWITFNEPIAFALEGFFRGTYPPGKTSFKMAGIVARNFLFSHVEVYQHLKKINPSVHIGIAHMINPIDAYGSWNPIEKLATRAFGSLLNEMPLNFFKTGKFRWIMLVSDYLENAPQSLDFIGINYYTHTVVRQTSFFKLNPVTRSEEKIVSASQGEHDDRGYYPSKVLYAEGLYRAIELASELNLPIFVTENGSSTADPALQEEFIKKHIYVVSKAIKEGHPVKGYLYWTLTDCFCWRRGYRNKHGIFSVDFVTQERTFRPVFNHFKEVIEKTKKST